MPRPYYLRDVIDCCTWTDDRPAPLFHARRPVEDDAPEVFPEVRRRYAHAVRGRDTCEWILATLAEHGPMSRQEVVIRAQRAQVDPTTAKRALDRLTDSREVRIVDLGARGGEVGRFIYAVGVK